MQKTMVWSTGAFVIGGAETLMVRMFQWAKKRSYRNILILDEHAEIDCAWEQELNKLQVELYYRKEKKTFVLPRDVMGKKLTFRKKEKVIGFATHVEQYMNLRFLELCFPVAFFKNYFYILHPYNVRVPEDQGTLKKFYKSFFYKNICKNNQLIFMTDEMKKYFEEYYGLVSKTPLIPLGMHIKKLDEAILYEREARRKKKGFVILTIGRFVFPFKAYILSAIYTYAMLKDKYEDIQLNIIGYGTGEHEVKRLIAELDKKKQSGITVIGKIPYEQLEEYIDNASILIAEGTCVLDGASRGIPICVSYAYQKKGIAAGLFHNEETIGVNYEKGLKYYIEKELVEQIYNMNSQEYIQISKKTYEIYKDAYDINKIMKTVLQLKVKRITMKEKLSFTLFECIRGLIEYITEIFEK